MKIKKLYCCPNLPDSFVVELLDGEFYRFITYPVRFISKKDLKPYPGCLVKGRGAEEPKPPEMYYRFYGLEKE